MQPVLLGHVCVLEVSGSYVANHVLPSIGGSDVLSDQWPVKVERVLKQAQFEVPFAP